GHDGAARASDECVAVWISLFSPDLPDFQRLMTVLEAIAAYQCLRSKHVDRTILGLAELPSKPSLVGSGVRIGGESDEVRPPAFRVDPDSRTDSLVNGLQGAEQTGGGRVGPTIHRPRTNLCGSD